ncbi:MAG: hypothetical protein ABJO02_06080 [Reichenbachiella sp.]|uniref:hypothetical protein n=1 Tax=Reichenbachiella sp. TaxID=2184521 RepID=UPI0032969704
MSEVAENSAIQNPSKQDQWFESLISSIKVDQLQIQTNTATEEKSRMYNNFIEGKHSEMFSDMRNISSQYFIEELVKEYISELTTRNVSTSQLAFDLSDAKVLVWAEIEDFDEESEDGLILAEAKTNAKFSNYGFHISSTIIEKGDKLTVPPHYSSVKN